MMEGRVELVALDQQNVKQLRRLNTVLFPFLFGEQYYQEPETLAELARLAMVDGKHYAGAVRCSLDSQSDVLYIMSLGVLAPFRDLGIGSSLLSHALAYAAKCGVASVQLHVWTQNADAAAWYRSRGFREVLVVEHYYRKLDPHSAILMRKDL